jgi:drug/metabolite transporter (DMT)-like permease
VTIPKVSTFSTWSAVVALIAATAVWGSTFVVTKQSLAQIAPASFLAWRFGIAAVVLVAIRPAKVLALSSRERRQGLGLACCLVWDSCYRPSDCRARPLVSPDF